jgi:hypothetical protein
MEVNLTLEQCVLLLQDFKDKLIGQPFSKLLSGFEIDEIEIFRANDGFYKIMIKSRDPQDWTQVYLRGLLQYLEEYEINLDKNKYGLPVQDQDL